MLKQAVAASSFFLERQLTTLDQCFKLTPQEREKVGLKLALYGNFFRYKYEAYYIASLTLYKIGKKSFTAQNYSQMSREIFTQQRHSGQIIKYPESYSRPVIQNTLKYAENIGLIQKKSDIFQVSNQSQVRNLIAKYANDLLSLYQINLEHSLQE